jgi:hypothetical protein
MNDKIVWDTGYGYEIGTYKGLRGVMCVVEICTAFREQKITVLNQDVHPYTDEMIDKMAVKYGYKKTFV